jgi:hypothetical protein
MLYEAKKGSKAYDLLIDKEVEWFTMSVLNSTILSAARPTENFSTTLFLLQIRKHMRQQPPFWHYTQKRNCFEHLAWIRHTKKNPSTGLGKMSFERRARRLLLLAISPGGCLPRF